MPPETAANVCWLGMEIARIDSLMNDLIIVLQDLAPGAPACHTAAENVTRARVIIRTTWKLLDDAAATAIELQARWQARHLQG